MSFPRQLATKTRVSVKSRRYLEIMQNFGCDKEREKGWGEHARALSREHLKCKLLNAIIIMTTTTKAFTFIRPHAHTLHCPSFWDRIDVFRPHWAPEFKLQTPKWSKSKRLNFPADFAFRVHQFLSTPLSAAPIVVVEASSNCWALHCTALDLPTVPLFAFHILNMNTTHLSLLCIPYRLETYCIPFRNSRSERNQFLSRNSKETH